MSQSASQAADPTTAGNGVSTADRRPIGPTDSLYARSAPVLSRGGERSPLETPAPLAAAAQRRVAERTAALASVAAQSRTYARDLDNAWALPTTGFYISTWFGEAGWEWSSGYHTGIDFATDCGTPEVAVTDAVVIQAGWDGPYGNQVRLRLPNGDEIWYNHMVEIRTSVGAHLAKGDLVGLVGETGNAYGCHLHFEYRLAADPDTPVDPAPFFAANGIDLQQLRTSPAHRR